MGAVSTMKNGIIKNRRYCNRFTDNTPDGTHAYGITQFQFNGAVIHTNLLPTFIIIFDLSQ